MRSRETVKATELTSLRQQNRELRTMNATKDEFIALASHQLRTPATAVKQYLGMLLEGYLGELTEAQLEFIQKAYNNNERQISTINDLLQVAQIDADKIVFHHEECNLGALLELAVSEFQGIAKTRQQQLILCNETSSSYVYADPLRLRMAIDNVVDNASKYSNEGTTITVTVGLRAHLQMYQISVTDQGVGIAKKDFSRLFQKFSRIDNPRSIIVGGNGLGLYLAKRIIEAHKGTIVVTSELSKGTTFTLRLPCARAKNMK